MDALDLLWHLLNFVAPGVGLGVLSATAAKLAWRRELAAVRWTRLAGWASAASCAVLVGGLVLTGRDGRMSTYGAMVLACAAALGWCAFGPGRR
jgi:hypothetical protein